MLRNNIARIYNNTKTKSKNCITSYKELDSDGRFVCRIAIGGGIGLGAGIIETTNPKNGCDFIGGIEATTLATAIGGFCGATAPFTVPIVVPFTTVYYARKYIHEMSKPSKAVQDKKENEKE